MTLTIFVFRKISVYISDEDGTKQSLLDVEQSNVEFEKSNLDYEPCSQRVINSVDSGIEENEVRFEKFPKKNKYFLIFQLMNYKIYFEECVNSGSLSPDGR